MRGEKQHDCEGETAMNQVEKDFTFILSFWHMQDEVRRVNKANGWHDTDRNFGELIALCHSELSEALEAKRHGDKASDHLPQYSGVTEELADTVIRIMDMASALGLPVAEAIVDKVKFNATRGYKHGKEF
jgi:NTP pyrophosphatase (non-canonical NTP hydrolase)